MAKEKLDWTNIEPGELPVMAQEAYDAYRAAYATMKAAKERFESTAREHIPAPEGKQVVFGYMFGKLAIALTDAPAQPKAKAAGTLAEWIAAQKAAGLRT